jgi:hypothetical protein
MRVPRIYHDTGRLVTTPLAALCECTGFRSGSAHRPSQLQHRSQAAVEELRHITKPRSEKPLFRDALR